MRTIDEATLRMDEHRNAELGFVVMKETDCTCLVYDYDQIISNLCKDMDYEEAVDFFCFNIVCAWVGNHTPVIRTPNVLGRGEEYLYNQGPKEIIIKEADILPLD